MGIKIIRNPRIPDYLQSKHLKPLFAEYGFAMQDLRVYRSEKSRSIFGGLKYTKIATLNWHYEGEYFELSMYDNNYTDKLMEILMPLLEKYEFDEFRIFDQVD